MRIKQEWVDILFKVQRGDMSCRACADLIIKESAEDNSILRMALEEVQNTSFIANFDDYEHAYEHACDEINSIAREALNATKEK